METNACSAGASSKDGHLVGIPAKMLDVFFDPLHCLHLVQHSIISRGHGVSGCQKSKWTKTIFYRYNYNSV